MKTKLRQLKTKSTKKTYTYLAIILSKKLMQTLNPTHVILNVQLKVTLPIKTRFDGRGYAIIPNEIVDLANFTKNQEINITLKKEKKDV